MSDMTQQENRHPGPDRARTPRPRARSGPLTRALGRVRTAAAAGMALLLGTLLATVLGAVPASAHGGDIILSIGGDGAGGISVNVTYKTDGHPVEAIVDVMVTAVSDAGTEIGPLQLSSASEGVGWYTSAPDVLTDGHWTVTATTTTPVATTATSQIDVVPPPAAPAPDPAQDGGQDGVEGDGSGEGTSAAGADEEGSGIPTTALAVGGAVLLLAAGAVLVVRRRATAARRP
ncbi:hypothetical protein ACFP63_10715 [Oerskovia jenensis]|uniref:LPXTG-motif cell wall-anchored protein n=1 Tax=Oerskovia jenensis TaxID=162169 RepID=A0ABS2LJC8_9CELL|nr:hypothetical protein [Oerskovia jenensis]MBM7480534.1 hypothetical protein [Oerskovia jenensis]